MKACRTSRASRATTDTGRYPRGPRSFGSQSSSVVHRRACNPDSRILEVLPKDTLERLGAVARRRCVTRPTSTHPPSSSSWRLAGPQDSRSAIRAEMCTRRCAPLVPANGTTAGPAALEKSRSDMRRRGIGKGKREGALALMPTPSRVLHARPHVGHIRLANIRMEPSRPASCAIMSPQRAAHSWR